MYMIHNVRTVAEYVKQFGCELYPAKNHSEKFARHSRMIDN